MNRVRVLISDDHPVFRDGIRALLEAMPETQVVGEATTGDEAVRLAGQLEPDVILMDVQMPGLNGIEATRHIVASHPTIRVLIVTMFEDDASVFMAMRAGAHGYVLKDATRDELRRAIRAVGNGEAIFSASIATRLIAYFARPRSPVPEILFPELTSREHEILELMAAGESNSAIASQLALSAKTVSNYVSNILNKLQVADRAEAIARARNASFGQENEKQRRQQC
ncbi:MAG: response regulator transcription factor [Chloroflexota bacterium]|nr:response regulator transcription factor [Chloroflexota bacterium]